LDIIQDFVESILNIKISKIYKNKELNDEYIFEKYLGISNVKIITDKNRELNIGIQIVDGLYIQNKMFVHYAQLYSDIIKTITINILDWEYYNTENYHNIIKVKDLIFEEDKNENSKEPGEIHVLELPKLQNVEIDTKDKAWINYLKCGELSEELLEKYPKIKKLDNSLNQYWKNEIL